MIRAVVLERQPHVAVILGQILARSADLDESDTAIDWNDVRRKVSAAQTPVVVVLGPDAEDSDLQSALSMSAELPATSFVLVADRLDAPTLQKAMRSGIRDVVSVEEAEAELPQAVARAHAIAMANATAQAAGERVATGKVVGFFGKGGAGKTFIAANVAVLLAQQRLRTVLFDAVPVFGDCPALLRVRPERTLADVANVPGELDAGVLFPILRDHPSRLKVLCGPADALRAAEIPPTTISRALEGLRRSFDVVIVDTGPILDAWTRAALETCDLAYLVTTPDLASVKNARLSLGMTDGLKLDPQRVRLILNRAGSKVDFPLDEVRKALGRPIDAELPSDVAVPRSMNRGIPLHDDAPRARIAKAVKALADHLHRELMPTAEASPGRSLLARAVRPRTSES